MPAPELRGVGTTAMGSGISLRLQGTYILGVDSYRRTGVDSTS